MIGQWIGALLTRKISFPAGSKVHIIGWTWIAKISLYFFPVILLFTVTIGSAENHDTAAYTLTDPPPSLTVERGQP
ncbi:hypothetical protein TNCV_3825321 [Trichonephila clavipes]|nr:hypothetical protein TNCV_3825321 [Trichonephila clavipes]